MAGLIQGLRALAAAALGGDKPKDPLATVEAELSVVHSVLDRARIERDAIEARLADAQAKREELLLSGADRAAIVAHDAEIAELADNKTSLDLFGRAEARRIPDLQAERQRLLIAFHCAKWHGAATKLIASMSMTSAKFADLMMIIQTARNEIGESVISFPAPPSTSETTLIVAPDLICEWSAQIERAAPGYVPPPAAAAPAPSGSPVRAARAKAAPPGPPRAKRATPLSIPVDGHVQVTVLRPGYEPPDGFARDVGETVWLPPDVAEQAVRNGAVDFVQGAA